MDPYNSQNPYNSKTRLPRQPRFFCSLRSFPGGGKALMYIRVFFSLFM